MARHRTARSTISAKTTASDQRTLTRASRSTLRGRTSADRTASLAQTARARAAAPSISVQERLGAALLHWWQVPAEEGEFMELDDTGNASILADRVAGADAVQLTQSIRPPFHASGAVAAPYLDLSASPRSLIAPIAIPAFNTVAFYVVCRLGTTSRYTFIAQRLGGSPAGSFMRRITSDTMVLQFLLEDGMGGVSGMLNNAPLPSDQLHLLAMLPTAPTAGCYVDGVQVGTAPPGFYFGIAKDQFVIGGGGDVSDGYFCSAMAVDIGSDAATLDVIVRTYYAAEYGLSL
jgi:hypothetical protein